LVAYNAVVDVAFEFLTFALKLGLLHYWLLKSVALALFVPAVPTRLVFHRVWPIPLSCHATSISSNCNLYQYVETTASTGLDVPIRQWQWCWWN
jgi:hypothetical protein